MPGLCSVWPQATTRLWSSASPPCSGLWSGSLVYVVPGLGLMNLGSELFQVGDNKLRKNLQNQRQEKSSSTSLAQETTSHPSTRKRAESVDG